MGSCDRVKREICTEKSESLSLVQRRSKRVYLEVDKKEVYLTIKVTINCTGILCRKER